MFITFEGIEGTGKTTQLKRVADYFRSQGREVVETKEPGGTEFGRKIREILLSPETRISCYQTELLLFTADRIEHVQRLIKPSIEEGKIVLSDRYYDSTYAYQLAGRKNPPELVDQMCQLVGFEPSLTLLLDLDPEEGLRRAKKRAALDRFETEALAFHHRVREGFLNQAAKCPTRIKRVDVNNKTPDEVFERLLPIIKKAKVQG